MDNKEHLQLGRGTDRDRRLSAPGSICRSETSTSRQQPASNAQEPIMQSQDTCVETQPLLHPLAQYEQAVRATSSSEAAHQTQQHHAGIIDPGDTQQPQPSQPSAPVAVSATQAPTAQAAERADETSTATATTRTIAGMNWNLGGLLQNPFSQRQADTEVASWELLLRDPEAFWLTQHGLLRVWMLVSVGSFAWSCYLDFITAQGVFLLAECAAVLSAIGGGIVVFKPCKVEGSVTLQSRFVFTLAMLASTLDVFTAVMLSVVLIALSSQCTGLNSLGSTTSSTVSSGAAGSNTSVSAVAAGIGLGGVSGVGRNMTQMNATMVPAYDGRGMDALDQKLCSLPGAYVTAAALLLFVHVYLSARVLGIARMVHTVLHSSGSGHSLIL